MVGRNYGNEMRMLGETYAWAQEVSCESIRCFVERASQHTLYVVGSGGSNTAAQFAALLHQETGLPAKALTPLGILGSDVLARRVAVLLLSAAARNWDIEHTARTLCKAEPAELAMLCFRGPDWYDVDDPSLSLLKMIVIPNPSHKDGFLATNSLLAFMVLLARAYSDLTGMKSLPARLPQYDDTTAAAGGLTSDREELLVLHGKWGFPGASDLESRCSEAALAHVLIADYRNFAHGRHYWLDKRPERSCVVLFSTPADRSLAERTAALLPPSVPILRIYSDSDGVGGSIELVIKSMYLAKVLGDLRGVDPGRPHVPTFGRKLYGMRFRNPYSPLPSSTDIRVAAGVSRKTAGLPKGTGDMKQWTEACNTFMRKVTFAEFGAVVFDYDGTLCPEEDRTRGIPSVVRRLLLDMLEGGIVIGIATGRGKSVCQELRTFVPREAQDRVLVGMYNGAQVTSLLECRTPNPYSPIDESLGSVLAEFQSDPALQRHAIVECRAKQVSVLPRNAAATRWVGGTVLEAIARAGTPGVRAFFSGHSWDVLAAGVSKRAVVEACSYRVSIGDRAVPILCVGDRGQWPGNDMELLSTEYSLSVASCSSDERTCWNLALPGYRGLLATVDYFQAMAIANKRLRFSLTHRKESLQSKTTLQSN